MRIHFHYFLMVLRLIVFFFPACLFLDKIYQEKSTNKELYDKEVKPIVEQVVKGYNGTVFAYGQTSSGKTFTMLGDKNDPGVIRLAARQIFNEISKAEEGCSFVIRYDRFALYNLFSSSYS